MGATHSFQVIGAAHTVLRELAVADGVREVLAP